MFTDYKLKNTVWELIPKLKATTSWELLLQVRELIKEEPNRVYMGEFINSEGSPSGGTNVQKPACGTQGCLAGWMRILTCGGRTLHNPTADVVTQFLLPTVCHQSALGLFLGYDNYPFPSVHQSQSEYAEEVIANLDHFMKNWETELKGFTLKPIPESVFSTSGINNLS